MSGTLNANGPTELGMRENFHNPAVLRCLTDNLFVARQAELEKLTGLLESSRLVTLVGPGGAGKTRLAAEWASRVAGIFVDLSGCSDLRDITAQLHRTLNAPSEYSDPSYLFASSGDTCLVLDNFEQLVETCAQPLGTWLSQAPNVRIVVTSRRPLGLRQEHVLMLGGLAEHDAQTLFEERAAAAGNVFEKDDAEAIRAICGRLDGMPLGIELAAAQTRTLSIAQLRSCLDEAVMLRHSARDVPDRHQSIHALIQWSWQLLPVPLQDALLACAIFPFDFALESALLLLSDREMPALEALDALVQHSLVRVIQEGKRRRFALFVSVKEFARQKLHEIGQFEQASYAFARCFMSDGLERLNTSRRISGWFGRERKNLLAAFDAMINSVQADSKSILVLALAVRHGFLRWDCDASIFERLEKALERTAGCDEPAWFGFVLVSASSTATYLGELDKSRTFRAQISAFMEVCTDAHFLGMAHYHLGTFWIYEGRIEEGTQTLELALEHAEHVDVPHLKGMIHQTIGYHLLGMERHQEAEVCLRKAYRCFVRSGTVREQAMMLGGIGLCAHQRGDLEEAERACRLGAKAMKEQGEVVVHSIALRFLGHVLRDQGKIEAAQEAYHQSLETLKMLKARQEKAIVHGALATLMHEQGDLEQAHQKYRGAIETLRALNELHAQALYRGLSAIAELEMGWSGGEASLRQAIADVEGMKRLDLARVLRVGLWAITLVKAQQAIANHKTVAAVGLLKEVAEALDTVNLRLPERRSMYVILKRFADKVRSGLELLVIGAEGRWFQLPSGLVVDFRRRRAPRRLLMALADHHQNALGEPLCGHVLLQKGWPEDRASPESLLNRLHVTLNVLRNEGLRDLLLFCEEGWLLDPEIEVRLDPRTELPVE